MYQKIIQFLREHLNDIILLIGVILISLLSFAAGYITAKSQEKEPLKFEETSFLLSPRCCSAIEFRIENLESRIV